MVETLPLVNGPGVFGLHSNAEIAYYTNAAKEMWRNLIDLQPRVSSSGEGMSREDYIGNTARDILSGLPETCDILLIRKHLGLDISPAQIVLLQELERWNNLISRMRGSLVDVGRALKGEIGMSEELDLVGESLFNGFLPAMWRRLAPQTEKPLGSWMTHYHRRKDQYDSWIKNGEPVVMWLSGLHIPESYITALVQTACRKRGWPLDKSALFTRVTKVNDSSQIIQRPDHGAFVEGIYLEGAAWDLKGGCLRLQDPKVLVVELPVIEVVPVEQSKLKTQGTFWTPVYVTQDRRNAMGVGLVFEAYLPTPIHDSHWILQGVGCVLNIDT